MFNRPSRFSLFDNASTDYFVDDRTNHFSHSMSLARDSGKSAPKDQHNCITSSRIATALQDAAAFFELFTDVDCIQHAVCAYPGYKEPLFTALIRYSSENTACKHDFMSSAKHFVQLCKKFPEYQARLLAPLLTTSSVRLRLIKKYHDLQRLCEAFPDYTDALFAPVLNNPIERARLIVKVSSLKILCKSFPTQEAALLRPVLTDPTERARLIKERLNLDDLALAFPQNLKTIVGIVLSDQAFYQQMITSATDLVKLAIHVFPDYEAQLLRPLLTDPAERARIISDGIALALLGKSFPDYKTELSAPVLTDANALRRLVNRWDSLQELIEVYPQLEIALVEMLLNADDAYFKQIIATTSQLITLAETSLIQVHRIYQRAVVIGLQKFEIFSSPTGLTQFVTFFSTWIPTVFDSLLNEPTALADFLVRQDGTLSMLLHLFPEKRQKILRFAAACVPATVQVVLDSIVRSRGDEDTFVIYIEGLEITTEGKQTAHAELSRFTQEIEHSKKMLAVFQRREFAEIIKKYRAQIVNLMIIMSPTHALALLASMTSISIKRLEQFLAAHRAITTPAIIALLTFILDQFAATLSDKKNILIWEQILLVLSVFDTFGSYNYSEKIKLMQSDLQNARLADVAQKIIDLSKSISTELLGVEIHPSEIDQTKLASLTGSKFWQNLITGKRNLAAYQDWFAAMLACDVSKRSLDNLLHDTNQAIPGTRLIAEHNANIRTQLSAAGINPDRAIYYKKTHAFAYTETQQSVTDWHALAVNIKTQLEAFKLALEQSELLRDRQVKGLYNDVDKLLNELSKGSHWFTQLSARIQAPGMLDLIASLHSKLEKLNVVITGANHLAHTLKELIESKKVICTRLFVAMQWDKSRPDTFYLGNYLDCCLAIDGNKARGIIERRLDDAMPIHVVLDQATNQPVCAVWLFWATDENDGTLKLVANYFELNNGHSKDEELKHTLLSNLMYFTGEIYTKDVASNAKNVPPFVMRHLIYGNISNFTKFKNVSCYFPMKLGGFCMRQNLEDSAYYLNGLNSGLFHFYTPQNRQAEFPKVTIVKAAAVPAVVVSTMFADQSSTSSTARAQTTSALVSLRRQ